MESVPLSIRRASLRLAIVVLLSLLVASACYSVSVTPAVQTLVSANGGRPGERAPENPSATGSATTSTAAPTDASSGSATTAATASQAAPLTRPAGGRPASFARGLPELAMNLGVIAVLIVIVSGVQARLRIRHQPRSRQASA